jgi:hypothetical protein
MGRVNEMSRARLAILTLNKRDEGAAQFISGIRRKNGDVSIFRKNAVI